MAAPHVAGILLFQTPQTDGYAIDDPDGTPDPIAHFEVTRSRGVSGEMVTAR